jgi:hypothetical protein
VLVDMTPPPEMTPPPPSALTPPLPPPSFVCFDIACVLASARPSSGAGICHFMSDLSIPPCKCFLCPPRDVLQHLVSRNILLFCRCCCCERLLQARILLSQLFIFVCSAAASSAVCFCRAIILSRRRLGSRRCLLPAQPLTLATSSSAISSQPIVCGFRCATTYEQTDWTRRWARACHRGTDQ